ncbi:MAG: methyl-accepting chemotaxis protein [Moritella sp.]|uniref:methyl-accepting chemotaxis protein n=1 Tax=Moritella sp. TaxID=78556 RepID=UPI0029ACEC20|nr:methyl-accepting chemotaxis protein [Moritella sp.]MDX2321673.1 methyl-accepting chemotaxis protein [Moritella sp.]
MFKLNQYSFGKRIGFGFAIIIFLLLSVYAESLRSRAVVDQGIVKLNAANVGVREVFGLQVLENNYLNTRDPLYAQRFNKWHKVNLDNFIATKHVFNSSKNLPLVSQFESANREYGQFFNVFNQQVVTIQQTMQQLLALENQWRETTLALPTQLRLIELIRSRERVLAMLQPEVTAQWLTDLLALRDDLPAQTYSIYLQSLNDINILLEASITTRNEMLQAALAVRDSAKKLVVNIERQMAEEKQLSFMLGLSVSICAVFACGVIGYVITRSVVKPIQSSIEMVEQLAQGQLYHQLKPEGRDEIASLVSAINHMSTALHHMVGDIKQNLVVLTQMTGSMTDIAVGNKQGTEQQLLESEQLAAAMTQMSATMTEISQSVSEVASSVRDSQELITSCNKVSDLAMTDIKVLSTNITAASGVVNNLAEETENINSVLDVINGISDQINLLSLNAAIEAARAGEQGRGFAVVADEVRLLAQRTQTSTQEIHSIIESLRSGAGHAVKAMSVSQTSVASSRLQVEEIGSHISHVAGLINNVEEQTVSLSQAMIEQSATSESFNRSLQVIVNVTRTASTTGEELAGSALKLSQCKDEIYTHMNEFELSEH